MSIYGNNGWARNLQTKVVMSTLPDDLEKADLPMAQVKEAMESIDYGKG